MRRSVSPSDAQDVGELLLAEEVARRLRLPLSTVYHLAKKGELPAVRFGRSWRFPATGIQRLLAGPPGRRVLVVDDDAVTRSLVTGALEPEGYQVWEAEGVDQALELCRTQRFDAFFIDLKMPGRGGIELIRILLGRYSLGQMVVITGYPDLSEAAELLELGPLTLLRKPLAVNPLKDCIKRISTLAEAGTLPT